VEVVDAVVEDQRGDPLVERGWVSSGHGPTGGYELSVSLDSISVLDVVEAIDGPTDTGKCVVSGRSCNTTAPCPLHLAWASARTALLAELDATPLSRLAVQGTVQRTV